MADSIVIRFATQSLKQARETAKAIARQVKDASRNLKELAPEARKQFAAKQRELAKQRQDEIKADARRLGLAKSQAGIASRDAAPALGAFNRSVSTFKEGAEKAKTLSGAALAPGGLTSAFSALSALPGVGQAAALVAAVSAVVLPELLKIDARRQAARDQQVRDLVTQSLERGDFAKRLENDVQFRARQARRAADLFLATERARTVGGWEPRSGKLIEVN